MTVLKCSTRSDNGLCLGIPSVPVLNVTSRVFWLELDDKALLDSYGVLQEGIGSSWRETYSGGHAAWPSGPGGLAQLHAIAKESVAYIYYSEHSHRRTHCAGIQQREAPAAGRAPMDEHQFEVEGAERPYVRPRSYREAQRISQHLVI